MPIYRLGRRLVFPAPSEAEEGLLAVGGDLSPERLLLAYRSGIFPWYDDDSPILWHSPDPRCVFVLDRMHAPRSLRRGWPAKLSFFSMISPGWSAARAFSFLSPAI